MLKNGRKTTSYSVDLMKPLTKREKTITGIIAILILLVISLSFMTDVFSVGSNKYADPPSMEKYIENASIIFLCKKELHGKTVQYKINEIIYENERSEFPYEVGEFFPWLQQEIEQGIFYGEGQVVILSSKSPLTDQSVQIMKGVISDFNNIKIDDFVKKVESMKN